MIGPGKYDEALSGALKSIDAREGILMVIDGFKGPAFCSQLSLENIMKMPAILRAMADQIEADLAKGEF